MNIVSLHPGKSERGHHESQHNSLKTGHLATLYMLFLKPAIETGKTGLQGPLLNFYPKPTIHITLTRADPMGLNQIPSV